MSRNPPVKRGKSRIPKRTEASQAPLRPPRHPRQRAGICQRGREDGVVERTNHGIALKEQNLPKKTSSPGPWEPCETIGKPWPRLGHPTHSCLQPGHQGVKTLPSSASHGVSSRLVSGSRQGKSHGSSTSSPYLPDKLCSREILQNLPCPLWGFIWATSPRLAQSDKGTCIHTLLSSPDNSLPPEAWDTWNRKLIR